jgi:hypothetical protein
VAVEKSHNRPALLDANMKMNLASGELNQGKRASRRKDDLGGSPSIDQEVGGQCPRNYLPLVLEFVPLRGIKYLREESGN